MVCYGGSCEKTCPMYEFHNPRMVECRSCGSTVLSWYVEDGMCPECRNANGGLNSAENAGATHEGRV